MRTFVLLFMALTLVCSCGDKPNTEDSNSGTARPTHLFSIIVDRDAAVDTRTVLGLWESTPYFDKDLIKQIRWKVEARQMTIAKHCTYMGKTVVAQVTAPISFKEIKTSETTPNGSATVSNIQDISINEKDIPEPQVVKMKDDKECTAVLKLKDASGAQYLIEDEGEFIFSGEIDNGSIEMTYLNDGSVGALNKIQN